MVAIVITCNYCRLFVDRSKLDQKCRDHLLVDQEGGVKIFGYDEVVAHVTDIANQNASGKIWVSIYIPNVVHVMLYLTKLFRSVTSPVTVYHKLYLE